MLYYVVPRNDFVTSIFNFEIERAYPKSGCLYGAGVVQ